MTDLPNSWMRVTVNDVGEITTGNTPPTKQSENYGGDIPFVKPGDLDSLLPITKTEQTLSNRGAEFARLLRPGAVLVSCIGNLGKIGFAGVHLATNQQINSIEFTPSIVHDSYGFYYCKTLKPWMEKEASATTVTILNKGRFSKAPFVLAPLNEQKRIAEKLDTLLTRVDSCKSHLERIPQILKRFRQSVLAAATSGRLTEDWREQKGLSFDDWITKNGKDVFPFITSGSRGWAEFYSASGAIFLRVGNLDHDTIELDLEQIQHVNPPDGSEGKRTRVQAGDILISITADVGMVAYLREDIGETYINQHICLARQTGEYVGEFLAYYLASPIGGLGQLTKAQRGATKAGLTLGDIRELNFKVPTTQEQGEIVRRVEKLFAYADRLEARYWSTIERVEQLTPSLLAKAFRGELIEQDPNDEPAERLLEHIQTKQQVRQSQK